MKLKRDYVKFLFELLTQTRYVLSHVALVLFWSKFSSFSKQLIISTIMWFLLCKSFFKLSVIWWNIHVKIFHFLNIIIYHAFVFLSGLFDISNYSNKSIEIHNPKDWKTCNHTKPWCSTHFIHVICTLVGKRIIWRETIKKFVFKESSNLTRFEDWWGFW